MEQVVSAAGKKPRRTSPIKKATKVTMEQVVGASGKKPKKTRPIKKATKEQVVGASGKKPRSRGRKRRPRNTRKVIHSTVGVLRKKYFKNEVGIEGQVFVGGSVGQGTTVAGFYDLDLVLYSPDIVFKKAARDGYDDLLTKINAYLQRKLSPNYTFLDKTDVAIKFKYSLPEGGDLDVDLLLSPFWMTKESFFHDLAQIPKEKRLMFSAGASKYQTAFIKPRQTPQNDQVRELIRRAKAWRNVSWPNGDDPGRPKSYLISLLVITAYRRIAGNVSQKIKPFPPLARKMNGEMVKIVREIAMNDKVNFIIPGTGEDVTTSDLLPPCPRIIDPVNPSNNLYLSGVGPDPYGGEDGNWRMFKEKIPTIDLAITVDKIMQKMQM